MPLNHGSFGACPAAVLQRQWQLRERMESAPGRFFLRESQPLLDESRRALAECIGADADDLVFVANTRRPSTPCCGRCGSARATSCC